MLATAVALRTCEGDPPLGHAAIPTVPKARHSLARCEAPGIRRAQDSRVLKARHSLREHTSGILTGTNVDPAVAPRACEGDPPLGQAAIPWFGHGQVGRVTFFPRAEGTPPGIVMDGEHGYGLQSEWFD